MVRETWVGFANTGDRAQAHKDWITQNPVANNATTWTEAGSPTGNTCGVAGDTWSLDGPLLGPTVPTVFDTRDCAQTEHQVWIIVPNPDVTANGVAECGETVAGNRSGIIRFDSGSLAVAPMTFFGYTPCTLETNNTMTFYGQLYGGNETLRNSMTMRYVPIGIPGVELPGTNPSATSGFRVDVVYKREIRNP